MKPVEGAQLANRPNGGPGPEEMAQQTEQENRILALLDTLPKNKRQVLLLKFQQGLSYAEISQITGFTVTNVGFLIHTGLLTLRVKLGS